MGREGRQGEEEEFSPRRGNPPTKNLYNSNTNLKRKSKKIIKYLEKKFQAPKFKMGRAIIIQEHMNSQTHHKLLDFGNANLACSLGVIL